MDINVHDRDLFTRMQNKRRVRGVRTYARKRLKLFDFPRKLTVVSGEPALQSYADEQLYYVADPCQAPTTSPLGESCQCPESRELFQEQCSFS